MSKQIQIYEVNNTDLLFVITGENSDASYYDKNNLMVGAVNGYVVLYNNNITVLRELPRDFVSPKESSVTDLVEIIQGYINNVTPTNQAELDSLTDIFDAQTEGNELLKEIKNQSKFLEEILIQLKISNTHNQIMSGEEIAESDVK